jgi:hypothetical protein
MWMGDWRGDEPKRKPTRKLVCADDKKMRVRKSTKPTTEDLKTYQGYLEREIKRLQMRHAEITRRLA